MSALNRLSKTQKLQLTAALNSIATGHLKGTGVKLEMEAHFNRPHSSGGSCDICEGSGYEYCDSCDSGDVEHEHYECDDDCDISYETCGNCDGEYQNVCGYCDGAGESDPENRQWADTEVCQQYIVDQLPKSAKDAIKYIRFYRDGSVDSECTVTVPIDKAHLLVHFLQAWTKLGEAIGNGMEIEKAGMHISILNDPTCYYTPGADLNRLNPEYVANFKEAMLPLLPALYFLASPSQQSRGLSYRTPRIDSRKGGVYPAICTHDNTIFEYRIFETCYDNPLMLVDFLIVIANTLKFYSPDRVNTTMKIGNLGIKEGRGLDRFYYTPKHLLALDKGLVWLKPDYKSIAQLKLERDFKVDKKQLQTDQRARVEGWKQEWSRVKHRNQMNAKMLYHEGLMKAYDRMARGNELSVTPQQYAKNYVKDRIQYDYSELTTSGKAYVRKMTEKFINQADYSITV